MLTLFSKVRQNVGYDSSFSTPCLKTMPKMPSMTTQLSLNLCICLIHAFYIQLEAQKLFRNFLHHLALVKSLMQQIIIIWLIDTISAWLQPQGSIFQNRFLGGGQFKKSLKKWTFWPKSGGLFKKSHKNRTFQFPGALFKSGAAIKPIRYLINV